jgi:hypothetical protein
MPRQHARRQLADGRVTAEQARREDDTLVIPHLSVAMRAERELAAAQALEILDVEDSDHVIPPLRGDRDK